MNTRGKLIIAAALIALVLTSGASCLGETQPTEVEVEDCDAEDYRNREAECGFTDADRRKTPRPVKTQSKPTRIGGR